MILIKRLFGAAAVMAGMILATPSAIASGFEGDDIGDILRDAPRRRARACFRALRNKLQIVHSSDNESSFVDPNTLEPKLLNYAAIASGLRTLAHRECIPSLHLTAGDHTIPGPFYQASAAVPGLGSGGVGDIIAYNSMLVRANGMGNHEFDGGINDFAKMLDRAAYPFIAANLDFTNVQLEPGTPAIPIGRDGGPCFANRGKVVKSCWLVAGMSRVGVIGRAPADFFNVIANPPVTIPGLDFVGGRDPVTNQPLVSAVQQVLEQVRLLERRGIRRIILIDHAQDFTADPLSASSLRGIDIIVAAGSTGFMAQPAPDGPFNLLRPEDAPGADYPTRRTDSEGKLVLVINSDQQYRYVGNLIVRFNRRGEIVAVDGRSGPIATTAEGVEALGDELGTTLQAPTDVIDIQNILDQTPIIQNAFAVVGSTNFPLNGLRADVRTRETNLGRLAADSTLWFARQDFPTRTIDVALKNGGGIRDTITGPNIIRLTIQAALAFDNQLAVFDITGAQLLAAMENSVSRVPSADGRFPQIAGMQMTYDANQPGVEGQVSVTTASRVRELSVTRANGTVVTLVSNGVAQPAALSQAFTMATNSFLTTGGDGYASFATASAADPNFVQTTTGEQAILEQYIQQQLGGVVNLVDPSPSPRVVRAP